jgi:hypothetical protein
MIQVTGDPEVQGEYFPDSFLQNTTLIQNCI